MFTIQTIISSNKVFVFPYILDDILQEVFRYGDDAVYTGNLVANAYLVYMGLMKASFEQTSYGQISIFVVQCAF